MVPNDRAGPAVLILTTFILKTELNYIICLEALAQPDVMELVGDLEV